MISTPDSPATKKSNTSQSIVVPFLPPVIIASIISFASPHALASLTRAGNRSLSEMVLEEMSTRLEDKKAPVRTRLDIDKLKAEMGVVLAACRMVGAHVRLTSFAKEHGPIYDDVIASFPHACPVCHMEGIKASPLSTKPGFLDMQRFRCKPTDGGGCGTAFLTYYKTCRRGTCRQALLLNGPAPHGKICSYCFVTETCTMCPFVLVPDQPDTRYVCCLCDQDDVCSCCDGDGCEACCDCEACCGCCCGCGGGCYYDSEWC